jgi:hypothetical protein
MVTHPEKGDRAAFSDRGRKAKVREGQPQEKLSCKKSKSYPIYLVEKQRNAVAIILKVKTVKSVSI